MIQNPGHWQTFLLRNDNRKLTVEQARQKYMKEQLLFEQVMFQQQMLLNSSAASVGGPMVQLNPIPEIPSNCFQYTVDTTSHPDSDFEVITNAPTNVTVDWGDGFTEQILADGSYVMIHTYDNAEIYTVRVCFDSPENVTSLEFFS